MILPIFPAISLAIVPHPPSPSAAVGSPPWLLWPLTSTSSPAPHSQLRCGSPLSTTLSPHLCRHPPCKWAPPSVVPLGPLPPSATAPSPHTEIISLHNSLPLDSGFWGGASSFPSSSTYHPSHTWQTHHFYWMIFFHLKNHVNQQCVCHELAGFVPLRNVKSLFPDINYSLCRNSSFVKQYVQMLILVKPVRVKHFSTWIFKNTTVSVLVTRFAHRS